MPFKALLYITRKAGTTPTEFRNHYENVHMPLIKGLAGPDFPLSHKRYYLARPAPGEDDTYPAVVLMGSQTDFSYDAVTEVTFGSEEAMKVFFGRRMEPGTKEIIDADEEKFLESSKVRAVILGEVNETLGESSTVG
ncbi:EthD domain-containing protein [Aspergillus avenaceus]|uniref:EthD domain-containing protein n=1 Tax=Aspergillus avenaceus TaxID=36643 RepID=A0A5N6TQH6_ASPAV|nr:EthD domain-containing protein [Aspergillus avenaceus]